MYFILEIWNVNFTPSALLTIDRPAKQIDDSFFHYIGTNKPWWWAKHTVIEYFRSLGGHLSFYVYAHTFFTLIQHGEIWVFSMTYLEKVVCASLLKIKWKKKISKISTKIAHPKCKLFDVNDEFLRSTHPQTQFVLFICNTFFIFV